MKTTEAYSTDEQLWNQFRAGEPEALACLYDRYVQKLYGYGRKFSAESEVVKDCIQDLFSDLLSRPQRLSDTPSVKNYLMKALRHRLINHSHRRPFWNLTDEYAFELIPSAEALVIVDQATLETQQTIRRAVAQLTKRQQEIVYLKFYHDLDNQAIAEVMSLTYQAVCNLISRALKAIRDILTGPALAVLLAILD